MMPLPIRHGFRIVNAEAFRTSRFPAKGVRDSRTPLGMVVSRILYRSLRNGDGHFSSRRSGTPPKRDATNTRGFRLLGAVGQAILSLCYVLHRMGFFMPPCLRLERWALTPPFHPCPARLFPAGPGGMFSVTLSVIRNFHCEFPRVLRGMLPCGVRTFLCPPKRTATVRHPFQFTPSRSIAKEKRPPCRIP